jgi:hypothetical protein
MITIKSILFIMITPMIISGCFFTNQINVDQKINRSPGYSISYIKAFSRPLVE